MNLRNTILAWMARNRYMAATRAMLVDGGYCTRYRLQQVAPDLLRASRDANYDVYLTTFGTGRYWMPVEAFTRGQRWPYSLPTTHLYLARKEKYLRDEALSEKLVAPAEPLATYAAFLFSLVAHKTRNAEDFEMVAQTVSVVTPVFSSIIVKNADGLRADFVGEVPVRIYYNGKVREISPDGWNAVHTQIENGGVPPNFIETVRVALFQG